MMPVMLGKDAAEELLINGGKEIAERFEMQKINSTILCTRPVK